MTTRPPRLIVWLLERAHVEDQLIGDLFERYATNQSRVWLWRQLVAAATLSLFTRMKRHPGRTAAIIGTGVVCVGVLWIIELTRPSELPPMPSPPRAERSVGPGPFFPPPPPPPMPVRRF